MLFTWLGLGGGARPYSYPRPLWRSLRSGAFVHEKRLLLPLHPFAHPSPPTMGCTACKRVCPLSTPPIASLGRLEWPWLPPARPVPRCLLARTRTSFCEKSAVLCCVQKTLTRDIYDYFRKTGRAVLALSLAGSPVFIYCPLERLLQFAMEGKTGQAEPSSGQSDSTLQHLTAPDSTRHSTTREKSGTICDTLINTISSNWILHSRIPW